MELIKTLMDQTGIGQEQAEGGAGLLFKLAKEQLSGEEFGQVAQSVPEADALAQAAPQAEQGGGGLGGMLGGLASAIGGDAGGLGDLAGLVQAFSKLGLDSGMLAKIVPIVLAFVQQKGGDSVKDILAKVIGSVTS